MIPEEIQHTIQQILGIQRDLQEKQLQNTDNISQLTEDISQLTDDISLLRDGISVLTEGVSELIEHSKAQDRRLEQLIGYSITAES